jgi:broad specificity phosphatase PhoE
VSFYRQGCFVVSQKHWQIPPSVLRHLGRVPADRAVVLLLRHSVRDDLPPDDIGNTLPITDIGRQLAMDLGQLMQGKLRTLHSSPLVRCMQTAQAISEGACAKMDIIADRYLGDPGVFVIDSELAWINWKTLGHEGVMAHLVSEAEALPGMARPDEAACQLLQHMFAAAGNRSGVHVFVTHDSLVTATSARLLGQPLGVDDWPWYLEAAFFWIDKAGVHGAYREHEACLPHLTRGWALPRRA